MRSKCLWLVLILSSVCVAYADESPQVITVLVGQTTEALTKTPEIAEADKVFVEAKGNALTGKQPTKFASPLDLKLDHPVRVLKVDGIPTSPKLVQGKTATLNLSFSDADGMRVAAEYMLESSRQDVATTENHQIKGVLSGTAASDTTDIRIKIDGRIVATVPYTVVESIKSIVVATQQLALNEGGAAVNPGVTLIGTNTNKAYTVPERPLTIEASDFVELTPEGWLRAKDLPQILDGPVKAVAIYDSPDLSDPSERGHQEVLIELRAGSIEFSPPTALLPPFGEVDFLAVLRARDGRVLPAKLSWNVPVPFKPWVAIAPSTDRVKVLWTSPTTKGAPLVVNVEATAMALNGAGQSAPITATLPIRLVGSVVAFEPIGVQLTIIDDRTVTDLYGKKTAEEYYVARIRFNNNIQNEGGEKKATSFLAFSDSIEVGVTLQKRRTKEALKAYKAMLDRGKDRYPKERFPYMYEDLANDWMSVSERELFTFIEPRSLTASSVERVLNSNVEYEGPYPEDRLPVLPRCTGGLTYRPHTFEMMVNSVDSRSDRSRRSIAFTTLATIGTAAAFVTSVSPPTGGSVLNASDKFTNLLIPGLAKLFPSLKETQRQNVVAHTMRPIEEIPYGSDLSRILFFPKQTFTGIIPDYEVRIASICPFQFKVQVALLNKGDIKTLGAAQGQP